MRLRSLVANRVFVTMYVGRQKEEKKAMIKKVHPVARQSDIAAPFFSSLFAFTAAQTNDDRKFSTVTSKSLILFYFLKRVIRRKQ